MFNNGFSLFHFSVMIYAGIGNYGVATSESQRSDLVIDYSRLNAEILKYSEDGINIMVANEWLEQPPLSVDRQNLLKNKSKKAPNGCFFTFIFITSSFIRIQDQYDINSF
nr:DUF3231 family protein [Mesobacillus boroniphilus]